MRKPLLPMQSWSSPGRRRGCWRVLLLPLCGFLLVPALAQDALRLSLADQSAGAQRRASIEHLPYDFQWGDLKLHNSASFSGELNDNVNTTNANAQQDIILRPMANADLYWPVTELNLVTFSVGLGYAAFLQHSEYDQLIISPNSALGWDLYLENWQINLHDQFSYEQDPTTWGAVSGHATYGGFYNTAGVLANWDLHDIVLSFGYDHYNFLASSSAFGFMSRASDFGTLRGSFKVHATATAGLEVSGGPTTYNEHLLSDNLTYSLGGFADWHATEHIEITPRMGYYIYDFSETKLSGGVSEQTGSYFSLQPRERLKYSLEGGLQAYMGNSSSLTEEWYGQLTVDWRVFQRISLGTTLRYTTASQPIKAQFSSDYERVLFDLWLSARLQEKLTADLEYRLYVKTSNQAQVDYTQNSVVVRLTYSF